jgi:DNA-binding sugar fermentation-stimulating protein
MSEILSEIESEKRRAVAERAHFYNLRAKYGVSRMDFELMEMRQGGLCAICKKPCSVGQRLGVDHCHETGKIRGLLCRKCNVGLGFFMDNPRLLQAAIVYLDRHSDSGQPEGVGD